MSRISTKNQVTLPVSALREAGLRAGDEVLVEALDDGALLIRRDVLDFDAAFGALTGTYPAGYLRRLDAEDERALRYVVDADVVIGALDAVNAHHADARALLTSWRERADAVTISVVNLSEVLIAPGADRRRLRSAREAIAALGLAAHGANEAIGVNAARLRRASARSASPTPTCSPRPDRPAAPSCRSTGRCSRPPQSRACPRPAGCPPRR